MNYQASYLQLYKTGELQKRVIESEKLLLSCTLCPRNCKVNRINEEKGFCKSGLKPAISSFSVHNGEEPPISGINGSGTIFFTGCTMRCIFCQNYPISQLYNGKEYEIEDLADMMLKLQFKGCHNINFVTPTHFVPQIISSLLMAVKKGLTIPLVYNTSGYDNIAALKFLNGIIDIYLPDIKYADDKIALKYSIAKNYCESARFAVKEMYAQVGDLIIDEKNIAVHGLIIRHLVLPCNLSGSEEVLHFIANEISSKTYISLMSQYFPAHHAASDLLLHNRITSEEYEKVLKVMEEEKLTNGWIQPI